MAAVLSVIHTFVRALWLGSVTNATMDHTRLTLSAFMFIRLRRNFLRLVILLEIRQCLQ